MDAFKMLLRKGVNQNKLVPLAHFIVQVLR